MTVLKGLTRAGIGGSLTDERLIQLAAQYQFEAVDLEALSFIERTGVEQAKELLAAHQMRIGSIGLSVQWRTSEEAFQEGLKQLAQEAAAAAALGCTSCCTYILPSTDMKSAHFMSLAVRRLRVCAQILGAYGVRLGLEFVGPHHLRTAWANPFIWTLQETLDLIDAIGEPNVGLLFDAYHYYTNELTVNDILKLRADQIVHVHINDAPAVPVEQVLDNDRLYPGEGVIDLASFLQGLHQIGYQGVVSQEILTPTAPTDSPEVLLERSRLGFEKVFSAAGLVR